MTPGSSAPDGDAPQAAANAVGEMRLSAASWARHQPTASQARSAGLGFYADWVLDLDSIDVEEIATALADQTDYDHRWLFDPRRGEVVFWTSDTGIDGENPVEIDELDFIVIDPLPSHVWYQDMVDFADGISDRAAGRRLSASLQGRGAFRRFRNEVYGHHPELVSVWQAMRDARARVRAVQWLVDEGLVDEEDAQRFTSDNPEPALP
jgi:hypothetical protein